MLEVRPYNNISFGIHYYGTRNLLSKKSNDLLNSASDEINLLYKQISAFKHNRAVVDTKNNTFVLTAKKNNFKITLEKGALTQYDPKLAQYNNTALYFNKRNKKIYFNTPFTKENPFFQSAELKKFPEVLRQLEDFIQTYIPLFLTKK